jgi:addiction module RelE/StbE family toxin
VVVWTGPARRDLRQIHDYIAKDSKYYAKKVAAELREATDKLVSHPMIGRVVPESDNENVRELFLYSYRIIYQVIAKNVRILAVIHQKQDIPSIHSELLQKAPTE